MGMHSLEAELNLLTGKPIRDDVILYCMAMVAPWSTLSADYDLKIKLTPSPSSKRGRVVRFAMELFERMIRESPMSQQLAPLCKLKEAELSNVLLSGAKLAGAGIKSMKEEQKKKQRKKQKQAWLQKQKQFDKKKNQSQPKANPKKRKKRR